MLDVEDAVVAIRYNTCMLGVTTETRKLTHTHIDICAGRTSGVAAVDSGECSVFFDLKRSQRGLVIG